MNNSAKILTISLIISVLAINTSVAEEVVYLRSATPCKVTVYPAPDVAPLSEQMHCGEKAGLLERQGDFARVQMDENIIVWVNKKNITSETPAEQEVIRLMEYQKKIETEMARLNDQVDRLSKTSSKLIEALLAADKK